MLDALQEPTLENSTAFGVEPPALHAQHPINQVTPLIVTLVTVPFFKFVANVWTLTASVIPVYP